MIDLKDNRVIIILFNWMLQGIEKERIAVLSFYYGKMILEVFFLKNLRYRFCNDDYIVHVHRIFDIGSYTTNHSRVKEIT